MSGRPRPPLRKWRQSGTKSWGKRFDHPKERGRGSWVECMARGGRRVLHEPLCILPAAAGKATPSRRRPSDLLRESLLNALVLQTNGGGGGGVERRNAERWLSRRAGLLLVALLLGVLGWPGSPAAQVAAPQDRYEEASDKQREALRSVAQLPKAWLEAFSQTHSMALEVGGTTYLIVRLCANVEDDYCVTIFFVDALTSDGYRGSAYLPRLTTLGDSGVLLCDDCGRAFPLFFQDASGGSTGVGLMRGAVLFQASH